MGVESYSLTDTVVLYEASSPEDFARLPIPDHAVGVVADTGTRSFYIQETYDSKPTEGDVKGSYLTLGSALAKELSSRGVYTKEVLLTPSNPEVSLPKDLIEDFGKEKEAFKAVSLLWLWLVSPEHVQT